MSNAPKKTEPLSDIEVVPDAWERFERFATGLAKSPPQHREAKSKASAKRRSGAKAKRP
jgi:hypothetical protein